jgi:transposase-like protein
MTSIKTSNAPSKAARTRRKRTPSPIYSAQEKVQAVLAVWTDKARPAEVCRQLAITWMTFSQWQERAMEGMLQALESRVNLASGQALSPRLQLLLQKRQPVATLARLSNRLDQLQQPELKSAPHPASKPFKAAANKEPQPAKEATS